MSNGKMFLFGDFNKRVALDSANIKDGKFSFKLLKNNIKYLGLYHRNNEGIETILVFPTQYKVVHSEQHYTDVFMPETKIIIEGKLILDEIPNTNTKLGKINLKGGKQTEAYYNIDDDLFEKIDNNTAKIVKEKLQKYPYSFHLLYEIDSNKNSFSAQQIEDFLKLFKGEITKSETYKKLANYNQKRLNIKNLAIPLLEDNKGLKKEILDKSYKKHLIVFWASWCGPCRKEIPILKKMYAKYGNDIEFVSISTDTDKLAWQNALKQENMMWKQLIKSGKPTEDEALQIRFRVNQAIPYTVLVDKDYKVISFSTGLSEEKELEDLLKR